MDYAQAREMDVSAIPVVDIGPLRDGSDPLSVATALHQASQSLGFIYISGHGIPGSVIAQARLAAYEFFRAPTASKTDVQISAGHRGWLAQGGARMQDDAKPDLKESFVWGYQDAAGNTPMDHCLRGANQWPTVPVGFELHAMDWFTRAHDIAHHLMRGFALGLGMREDFFLRSCATPLSRASYVYYPAQSASLGMDQFGVGPHTDFGTLTVLCQDMVGGLQVQDINGEWIQAPPIADTLVVNVADLLSRWTAGAYKSTPHRVVNSSGRERLSLVLAFDPDPDTLIDAHEVAAQTDCVVEGPMPTPITCGDYLEWRFNKAFGYRKSVQ